jgi:hypothetical protein
MYIQTLNAQRTTTKFEGCISCGINEFAVSIILDNDDKLLEISKEVLLWTTHIKTILIEDGQVGSSKLVLNCPKYE